MDSQTAFDFADPSTKGYAEDAPGTWRHRPGLPSYRDNRPTLRVPARLWESLNCAMALSESGDSVAQVRPCCVQGRMYVVVGVMYHGKIRSGCAWTVVPLAAWTGATFSYRSLIAAMDRESIERGRETGLVVKIRGNLCVLDEPVELFDDNAQSVHDAGRDDVVDEENDDEEDCEAQQD